MTRDLNSVIITGRIIEEPVRNINGSMSFQVECNTLIIRRSRKQPQELKPFVFMCWVAEDHATVGRNLPHKDMGIRLVGHLEFVEGLNSPVIMAELIERKYR